MQSTIQRCISTTLLGLAYVSLSTLPFAGLAGLTACLTPRNGGVAVTEDDGGGGNGNPYADGSTSHADGSMGGGGHDGGSTGSEGSAPPTRGPTAATSTTAFPFPQNRQKAGCIYPTGYLNSDVQAVYAKWKADLVTSNGASGFRRVQRTSTDGQDTCRPINSSVSEGIGYGMLIAVYMDDQSLFDDLWQYEQTQLDSGGTGLMNWAPGPFPNGPPSSSAGCTGPATDADEDMAYALVMADKQWGGKGSLPQPYLQTAITQIQTIWKYEVTNYRWIAGGRSRDQMGWADNAQENISYFAPSYYRVFNQVDPKHCAAGVDPKNANPPCDGWQAAIDQSYATLGDALNGANKNQSNGLVPGWCNDSNGAPCTATGISYQPFYYQYDACRTPFRIGLDACFNAYPAAQSYVGMSSSFFAPIGAAQIVDGYNLDGTKNAVHDAGSSAAFVGPATVGAMSVAADQAFVDNGYALLVQDNAFVGGEYYDSSWTVLSLLMLTGNFLDYTQETPAH
jgi:endo-1,4-beta-D-glucanase Y